MKKISIDIPHFTAWNTKKMKKADCGDRFQGTGNLDKQIADPALGTSLSIGSDNRTGKRRDLHKYQAVSAGAVSGPGYFGKRPGKGTVMVIMPDGAKFKMNWKYITYVNHGNSIHFSIVPMYNGPDIVLFPNMENWEKDGAFSLEEREEIIFCWSI